MDIDTEIIFLEAQLPILYEWVRFTLELSKKTKTAPICDWPKVLRFNPTNPWTWYELSCEDYTPEELEEERAAAISKHEAVIDTCREMGWTAFWEAKQRYDYYRHRLGRLKELKAAGEKIAPNRTKYKDWKQPITEKPLTEE